MDIICNIESSIIADFFVKTKMPSPTKQQTLALDPAEITEQLRLVLEELRSSRQAVDASTAKDERITKLLADLHIGDIANFVESIVPDLRTLVWEHIPNEYLVAVVSDMDMPSAIATLKKIPEATLAESLKLAQDLEDVEAVLRCLLPQRRAEMLRLTGLYDNLQLLKSLSYAPDTIGSIMDFSYFVMEDQQTVGDAIASMRAGGDLPTHCDKVFVTNNKKLVGIIPLKRLLVNSQETQLATIMVAHNLWTLTPEIALDEAAEFFERYDLISVPVLNHADELLGRVTIDEILFYFNNKRHSELLVSSGLKDEEDLFAPTLTRLSNRAFWIFINLIAAFMISRIVGSFEDTIAQVISLAALMPIISNLAGNTGMQTATVVIRGLALNQVQLSNWFSFLSRELLLGCVNGLLWGVLVGIFVLVFYQEIGLALVLTLSLTLVFILGALTGFLVPVVVNFLRKDPALGTTVVVTTLTDCFAFFIFLGLASLYLVN